MHNDRVSHPIKRFELDQEVVFNHSAPAGLQGLSGIVEIVNGDHVTYGVWVDRFQDVVTVHPSIIRAAIYYPEVHP